MALTDLYSSANKSYVHGGFFHQTRSLTGESVWLSQSKSWCHSFSTAVYPVIFSIWMALNGLHYQYNGLGKAGQFVYIAHIIYRLSSMYFTIMCAYCRSFVCLSWTYCLRRDLNAGQNGLELVQGYVIITSKVCECCELLSFINNNGLYINCVITLNWIYDWTWFFVYWIIDNCSNAGYCW